MGISEVLGGFGRNFEGLRKGWGEFRRYGVELGGISKEGGGDEGNFVCGRTRVGGW